jgi:leucyl aminopeptidase
MGTFARKGLSCNVLRSAPTGNHHRMTQTPTFSFAEPDAEPNSATLVYFAPAGDKLPPHLHKIDVTADGAVTKAMEVSGFKGKLKNALEILAPHGLRAGRLLIVGTGDAKPLTLRDWTELGGTVRGKLQGKVLEADIVFDGIEPLTREAVAAFAQGFMLRHYAFKKYKSKTQPPAEGEEANGAGAGDVQARIKLFSSPKDASSDAYRAAMAVADGVYFARDLVNEPANILTPPEFTDRLRGLENEGLKVEVLDESALKSLGMNALLAVGQGSAQPSSAVILRWDGGASSSAAKPLVFVGKGVCFDTGGISMKPAQGMEDMKGDMAGAAAVAGTMLALARRKAPVRAIGLVGLVENMPDGKAIRPGDVVTSASGQTIEILNTDAEGRLVLADLIWYAQNHLNPRSMITLATLTGAILVALGKENAGLFSNDDAIANQLTEAGLDTGETVWRMPLSKKYDKAIDSKIADMKNIGGRDAGSITAAQFIQRFVSNGMPWAHLDIAGTAMGSPSTDVNHSWGSGYGVRLLNRFCEKFYQTD